MTLFSRHDHDELRELPDVDSDVAPGGCPALLPDGTTCGEPLLYAHSVREFHRVSRWWSGGVEVGPAAEFDAAEDEDPHLYCVVGHDWAVPQTVDLD